MARLMQKEGVVTTLDLGPRNGDRMLIAHERRIAPRTNHVLAARVAAELSHSVAHSQRIQVFAMNDWITLRGIALADEVYGVVQAVRNVRGVKGLTLKLDLRAEPESAFGLQD